MDKEFILNVCTKTWTRDSHGLFDYESNQVKPHEGNILDSALVVRKKMDIKLVKNINEIKEEELLFEIKAGKGIIRIKKGIAVFIISCVF